MPQEIETALFRLLQESLNYVHRHSGSKKVDVAIRRNDKEALVTIRDYGRGLPLQKLQDVQNGRSRGVGLTGLRERVAVLGGSLEVFSAEPGSLISAQHGSRLKISLPSGVAWGFNWWQQRWQGCPILNV
jgi:two-component system NarL family sensor kinase